MEKQILLPAAEKSRINKEYKASRNELSRALKYERNSSRAKLLRAVALEHGGLIFTGATAPADYVPNVETSFPCGFMKQSFGDRVRLTVNLSTNVADVYIDDKKVATFGDMTISSWSDVLFSLQQVYNQLIAKQIKL